MEKKPRILVVQPEIRAPGGAYCVGAYTLQALQDDFALDLLTGVPVRFQDLDRFFGTTLDARKIKNYTLPFWLNRLVMLDPDPYSIQRLAFLMRFVKWNRRSYDLVVSLCDEVDFGAPCFQYVYYPDLRLKYQRTASLQERVKFLLRPWRIISGFSFDRMRANVTLACSEYTGKVFQDAYDAPARTLYPPVPGNFSARAWAERETGFVCIGRFSGEKRYPAIIEILQAVRARGHAVRLHIVGGALGRAMDSAYVAQLKQLAAQHAAWVTLHENIARTELEELLARNRYGIHAMHGEHFGIAPAEMVRAGCIVFVPNSGGQVEIVGDAPLLRYESDADAVEKIARVLEDASQQAELRAHLAKRAALFSPEHFMRELRALVNQTLETKRG